ICNHSDETGRYAFDQQPRIGFWNLAALAQAMLSLISLDDAKAAINSFADAFNPHVHELMTAKLGLTTADAGDQSLWSDFLDLLAVARADYTIAFRALGSFSTSTGADNDAIRRLFPDPKPFDEWADCYRDRLRSEDSNDRDRQVRMDRVNPK